MCSKALNKCYKVCNKNYLYERKNYLADNENCLAENEKYLADSGARKGFPDECVGNSFNLAGKWSVENDSLCKTPVKWLGRAEMSCK